MNTLVDFPQVNGGSAMRNKYNLSPISSGIMVANGSGGKTFKESYLSPKVQNNQRSFEETKAMNVSGSTLKIPTITQHNQSFINRGQQPKMIYKSP